MQTINIHEAKTHLSRLVEKAAKGESFIIAKAGKPMVKVVAVEQPSAGEQRRVGFLAGQIAVPPAARGACLIENPENVPSFQRGKPLGNSHKARLGAVGVRGRSPAPSPRSAGRRLGRACDWRRACGGDRSASADPQGSLSGRPGARRRYLAGDRDEFVARYSGPIRLI